MNAVDLGLAVVVGVVDIGTDVVVDEEGWLVVIEFWRLMVDEDIIEVSTGLEAPWLTAISEVEESVSLVLNELLPFVNTPFEKVER